MVGAYGACVAKCSMEIRSTSERGVMRSKRRRSASTRNDDRFVSLMQTVHLSLRSAECLPACLPDACGAKTFWFQLIIRVFSRFSMNRKFHLALNNNWPDAPSSTYCRCCGRITSFFFSFALSEWVYFGVRRQFIVSITLWVHDRRNNKRLFLCFFSFRLPFGVWRATFFLQ